MVLCVFVSVPLRGCWPACWGPKSSAGWADSETAGRVPAGSNLPAGEKSSMSTKWATTIKLEAKRTGKQYHEEQICLLTSGSSPWWCRPKWVGRSSVGGINVPAKSNRACMACSETTESVFTSHPKKCTKMHNFSWNDLILLNFVLLVLEKWSPNLLGSFPFGSR